MTKPKEKNNLESCLSINRRSKFHAVRDCLFFVEIGHIPVIEKRVLNAGHRLHESWPVDKGKPFHT